MRLRLSLFLPLAFVLGACNNMTSAVIDGDDSSSSDAMIEASSSSEASSDEASSESMDTSSDSAASEPTAARIIEMTADDWSFAPNSITVAQGEHVVVRVTGVKGIHSFAIPDLNINIPIEPGETKDITIPTDTVGTFGFRCFVPCGAGHKEMIGTLVVS